MYVHFRVVALHFCLYALLVGCSSSPIALDNDDLSSVLSITNISKTPITDTTNAGLVTGLLIDAEVVNTGFFTIDVPFRMTWSLREGGTNIGTASTSFSAGFSPGASRRVQLRILFSPVATSEGFQDVVTFDIIGR